VRTLLICFLLATTALAADWPQWRGPSFNGSTTETHLPATWDATNHVQWATPLPGPGAATPVVVCDRIFLSAADKAAKEVLALGLDARSGKISWRQQLSGDHKTPGANDMASPSPVTDGTNVWFLTGDGALAAFTCDGQPLWRRDLSKEYGEFVANFGYSSSPLLYDGKLYVLALHSNSSYLLAVDPSTGKTLWKQERPTDATDQSRESYVTPYPFEWNGRREIIIAGGECVTAHDPASGKELWRWWFTPADRQIRQHNVPTPVALGDLIFVARSEHRPLFALRAGGKAVEWVFEANRCWIASPLVYKNRLYVLQEQERELACLEPKTGRVIWQQKLPVANPLQASPTGADDKIYLISVTGEVVVLAAGDEYRELGRTNLAEPVCRSTIVAANGRLYVRTAKNLYCIGVKPPPPPSTQTR